ncbi:hypothetical protein [Scale drop disease virus]|uniref:Uncharacterized protein n=1 Tax=Scale drop disease virus TaxID=1697349 RepID=A0A7D5UKX1_9VIRU|nr:hypothetical protein [Scale drop disease virus]QXJ13597.1 hypothetical protein PMJGCIOK_00030 [Scale drop disease virus]UNH60776.1 hypothetical protein SDDV_ORF107 [Scale drop disease virus]
MSAPSSAFIILSCINGIINLLHELGILLREKNKRFRESFKSRRCFSSKRTDVEKEDDKQHQ